MNGSQNIISILPKTDFLTEEIALGFSQPEFLSLANHFLLQRIFQCKK
jgi:hypothetical protein